MTASSRCLKPTYCDGVGGQGLENLCCVGSTVAEWEFCVRVCMFVSSVSGCVRVSMNGIVV